MSTTTNTGLNQPAYNSTSPTWDQPLNFNETILDAVFGNTTSVAMPTGASATTTLTGPTSTGSLGQTQAMRITLTGSLSANQILQFPSGVAGKWIIYNTTSGSFSVTVSSAGGGTAVSAPQGYNVSIYSDGTNIRYTDDGLTNNFATLTVLGNTYLATTSGNVGIGTTSPTVKLQVNGNTIASNFYTGTGTASAGIFGADSAGTGASIIMYGSTGANPGAMILNAGSSERMRIDSSGNVGIGTSSPSPYGANITTLDVRGTSGSGIKFGIAANYGMYYNGGNAFLQTFDASPLVFAPNNSERMRIDTSGNLLVGYTSSNGSYKLQVNSQIFATSSTIATSDANYKTNVMPLSGALDIVQKLNPVSFSWKEHAVHNFDTATPTVGFLAQEVQTALSSQTYVNSIVKESEVTLPDKTKEKFLGIAEGNMIALLTKAIQELKATVDAQAAEITALKVKVGV